MKAIDVATKNFITIEDVVEICKELNIVCKDTAAELSEKKYKSKNVQKTYSKTTRTCITVLDD